MSALDSVLADLIEADRECSYVTVKREPLEELIDDWTRRGDQVSLLCSLLPRLRHELAQAWNARALDQFLPVNASQELTLLALDEAIAESASVIAHHRHAVRRELAARLKQVLRSAIADVGVHVTDALLANKTELAERLESDRQTVRIVISTIDAVVTRLLQDEMIAASISKG
ncbi:MAG: hypothetical protein ABSG52_09445 [Terriglobales bacterium]|jgi:uncharacterized coiled-coil protein SlyX